MEWAAGILLAAGGLICCINFYLVFMRYPLFRLAGGNPENYRYKPGIPAIGSLLVILSLISFWESPWLATLSVILILMDIDGVHWYLLTYCYLNFRRRQRR